MAVFLFVQLSQNTSAWLRVFLTLSTRAGALILVTHIYFSEFISSQSQMTRSHSQEGSTLRVGRYAALTGITASLTLGCGQRYRQPDAYILCNGYCLSCTTVTTIWVSMTTNSWGTGWTQLQVYCRLTDRENSYRSLRDIQSEYWHSVCLVMPASVRATQKHVHKLKHPYVRESEKLKPTDGCSSPSWCPKRNSRWEQHSAPQSSPACCKRIWMTNTNYQVFWRISCILWSNLTVVKP